MAPLHTRRDIAVLGVIHRAVLGHGPSHFHSLFYRATDSLHFLRRRHFRHLANPYASRPLDIIQRSIFGLIPIYNLLPAPIIKLENVSEFQSSLQKIVKQRAISGQDDWPFSLSPRIQRHCHPLLNFEFNNE